MLIFSTWIILDVMVLHISSGVTRSSYDAMVRWRILTPPADPRIVVIDIDEASLAKMAGEFGRWPWPRDTLATVLDHLEKQAPLAIVWDIVFADADKLNPGGDAAFNAAVARSTRSHFSVIRLPSHNDTASQLDQNALPGLWLSGRPLRTISTTSTATVALIAPALPAVASSKLGFANGYPDSDGVLRRYRYSEQLPDGSEIQSTPLSVWRALDPQGYAQFVRSDLNNTMNKEQLIVWRAPRHEYTRLSFADVFRRIETGQNPSGLFDFKGKIVLIGSTAPSLHDIHPTPLSATNPGLLVLATVTDNLLNGHFTHELPRWLQVALTIALCAGIAVLMRFRSVVAVDPTLLLFAVPAALLGISYASLNGLPVYLDLQLAASLVLIFMGVLRYWISLRRDYWCSAPRVIGTTVVWPWQRATPWTETAIDRLIELVQTHAPNCRLILLDHAATWPRRLRWPELACYVAIAGPQAELINARDKMRLTLFRLAQRSLEPIVVGAPISREHLAHTALVGWARLQNSGIKKHADSTT